MQTATLTSNKFQDGVTTPVNQYFGKPKTGALNPAIAKMLWQKRGWQREINSIGLPSKQAPLHLSVQPSFFQMQGSGKNKTKTLKKKSLLRSKTMRSSTFGGIVMRGYRKRKVGARRRVAHRRVAHRRMAGGFLGFLKPFVRPVVTTGLNLAGLGRRRRVHRRRRMAGRGILSTIKNIASKAHNIARGTQLVSRIARHLGAPPMVVKAAEALGYGRRRRHRVGGARRRVHRRRHLLL